jgi:ribosome-associated protein
LAKPTLTAVVIDALEDIKGKDIVMLDVRKLTSVFDYIAIASGDSNRQTRALARHVTDKVREFGGHIYGSEGEDSGEWVLVDCGDVVVHVMQPAVREHYQLEQLWSEGKRIHPPAVKKAVKEKAPEAKKPAAKKPVAKKPAAKKPAAKKKPVAKKPAAKKPVAKKPAAKKPAAKKPAAKKKPAARKTGG